MGKNNMNPGKTREMKKEKENLLEMLQELAQKLSIEVRLEPIKMGSGYSEGGLCRVKGKYVLIINPNASIEEKIRLFTEAVKRFDLSGVYIKPALRSYLENRSFSP